MCQALALSCPCLAEDKSDKGVLRPAKSMDSLSAAAGANDGECKCVLLCVCVCVCVLLTAWACTHLCGSVSVSVPVSAYQY